MSVDQAQGDGMQVRLLSGGAAHGLVSAITPRFTAETGATISGTFSAVGAIRDKLLAGEPADAVILSRSMIAELANAGQVESAVDLGIVQTAIAVRAGDDVPAIGSGAELKAALLAADALYCPDPKLATAGIHFVGVLDKLGIRDAVGGRLRTFPNGMTAMTAMAQQAGGRPIGCTQVTEILAVPGLTLAGPLPKEHELATTYSAAIASKSQSKELARRLLAILSGPESADQRRKAGFDGP